MSETERPIRIGDSILGQRRHICAFFDGRDEEYETLLPFIKEGVDRGERASHIVDRRLRQDHLSRLERAGVPVGPAEATGQLEVRDWENAYLRGGHFDKDAMIALLEDILKARQPAGYPLLRLVAHMEWALEDLPGVDDLVEYESKINDVLPHYPDPVICVYDSTKFGAAVAMDILRTHPTVILGNVVQENPFYTPPDEFLREWRQRENAPKPA